MVLFSDDLIEEFESLVVDEERKHVLTRITKHKNGFETKESDHNVSIATLMFPWDRSQGKERIELFN